MKASSLRILSLLTLAAIWEIGGRSGNAHLLPPLSKVLRVWVELLISGQLLQAIAISAPGIDSSENARRSRNSIGLV